MKRFIFILVIFIGTSVFVFAQADRNTRYIAVQSTAIKSSTGFFANEVGNLSFGDTVTLIREDGNGKWSEVRFGSTTGWVESSKLSARRVIASSTTGVSASEVALAGKGFSSEMEAEFRGSGQNYSQAYSVVDIMEQITVPPVDLLRFITDGHLSKGD